VSAIASNKSDKEVRLCIQDGKVLDKAFGRRLDRGTGKKAKGAAGTKVDRVGRGEDIEFTHY